MAAPAPVAPPPDQPAPLEPLPLDADLEAVPLGRLEEEVTSLAAHLAAAEARFLAVLGAFDARDGWAQWGVRSCAQWLAWRVGLSPGAARERVRVARALPSLPTLRREFAAGRLSYSQVRALTRVATPDDEEQLVTWALECPAWQLEQLLRGVRKVRAEQADEQARAQHAAREVRWHWTDDGSLVLHAQLPPAEGTVFVATLERLADALLRDGTEADLPDGETPDLSGEGRSNPWNGAETAEVDAGEPDDRTSDVGPARHDPRLAERLRERGGWGALQADALLWLADAAGSGPTDRVTPALVSVHVDAAVLDDPGADGECRVEDGPKLATSTALRLLCEARVQAVADGEDGDPLRLGRTSRAPNRAQRRALRRRDGGCRFPGCGARRFIDAHHVVWWSEGGLTDIENLVLLCRVHHVLVHEGGFTLTMPTPGHVVVHDPTGRLVPEVPELPAGEASRTTDGSVSGVRPAADALEPAWYGDRLDPDLALALLPPPRTEGEAGQHAE